MSLPTTVKSIPHRCPWGPSATTEIWCLWVQSTLPRSKPQETPHAICPLWRKQKAKGKLLSKFSTKVGRGPLSAEFHRVTRTIMQHVGNNLLRQEGAVSGSICPDVANLWVQELRHSIKVGWSHRRHYDNKYQEQGGEGDYRSVAGFHISLVWWQTSGHPQHFLRILWGSKSFSCYTKNAIWLFRSTDACTGDTEAMWWVGGGGGGWAAGIKMLAPQQELGSYNKLS